MSYRKIPLCTCAPSVKNWIQPWHSDTELNTTNISEFHVKWMKDGRFMIKNA